VENSKAEGIVDTYVSLLVDGGVRSATIDAVAKACGLSKAGVLHYFRSRAELDAALVERLRVLLREDLRLMRRAEGGPVRYYLTSSLDTEAPLERAVVAASRLAQAGHTEARAALGEARSAWLDVLEDALGNPVLARLALLAGDGASHHADLAEAGEEPFVSPTDIEHFARIIER
jgi:AcrR family transcriptional regulator